MLLGIKFHVTATSNSINLHQYVSATGKTI